MVVVARIGADVYIIYIYTREKGGRERRERKREGGEREREKEKREKYTPTLTAYCIPQPILLSPFTLCP